MLQDIKAAADATYCVYMLRCADGSIYTGATNNVWRRFEVHFNKNGSKHVARHWPAFLVWFMSGIPTWKIATKMERKLKVLLKKEKLSLIAGDEHITRRVQHWLEVESAHAGGPQEESIALRGATCHRSEELATSGLDMGLASDRLPCRDDQHDDEAIDCGACGMPMWRCTCDFGV